MAAQNTKIFVGGISPNTKEESLRGYFEQYGEVVDSVVIRDRNTMLSRGFGFVTFSNASSRDNAVKVDHHVIHGKEVEVKIATSKDETINEINANSEIAANEQIGSPPENKKIFVGGLPPNLALEEFKEYFKSFGTINDAVIIHDTYTNKPRGFGFITFESDEAVKNVLKDKFHKLNTKNVEVKRAIPKPKVSFGGYVSGNAGRYYTHSCPYSGCPVVFSSGNWYNPSFAGSTSYSIHHLNVYGCVAFQTIQDYWNYLSISAMSNNYAVLRQNEALGMW